MKQFAIVTAVFVSLRRKTGLLVATFSSLIACNAPSLSQGSWAIEQGSASRASVEVSLSIDEKRQVLTIGHGIGADQDVAVQAASDDALRQVFGFYLESSSSLRGQELDESVSSFTAGFIDSVHIISSDVLESGLAPLTGPSLT
jgi:hypothetical protein